MGRRLLLVCLSVPTWGLEQPGLTVPPGTLCARSRMAAAKPAAFQVPSRANFSALSKPRGLERGDGLSEVPGSDRWSPGGSGKTDGTCGPPRHRGTELVLSVLMDSLLRGRMGTIIFSRCTTVVPTGLFIFALNAKSHWAGYPLPRINLGDFLRGGERQGLGGDLPAR